jgi:histidinol-phosphate aminotransferase
MIIDNLVRKPLKTIEGISWGNSLAEDVINLQFSELFCVYPPAYAAMQQELSRVNRYPSFQQIENVVSLIATANGVTPANIFLGNGVDALIDSIARTFCTEGDEVLLPSPTYPCYADAVQFMGAHCVYQDLESDFSVDVDAFLQKITPCTKLIYVANPNNPTWNVLLTLAQIEKILQSFRWLLVLDEEYFSFSGVTGLPLLKKYQNLIILRWFSKSFGIAGVRLGVLFADPAVIAYFQKTEWSTNTFAVNRLALAAASAIFSDQSQVATFIATFTQQKKTFMENLATLPSVTVFQTQTPFVIFTVPGTAHDFRQKLLLSFKIAVKDMAIYKNIPQNMVLVAVPDPKDTPYVLNSFRKCL